MADVKWIKLATNIFDNRKIRQIENLPDGYAIIVVWFKLLCLSGQINDCGLVYFTKEIPYTEQMIANQFSMPLTTVQLALRTFEQFGMIEIINDILHISNWEKYQNEEGLEKIREQNKIRQARYREKQKLLSSNVTNNVTDNDEVTSSNALDIDIRIRDKKENKELNNIVGLSDEKPTPRKRKQFTKPTIQEVQAYCQERNNGVDPVKWFNHYEANGWKVGKNPMKDWKAAVRTWERNTYSTPQKPQPEHGASRLMQMIKEGVFNE